MIDTDYPYDYVEEGSGYHWCPCCGCRKVEDRYDYCYGCMRKWNKVYFSCLAAGYSSGDSCRKADGAYPRNLVA